MCDYKFLVATDMDYTLLLPGRPVSDENRRAVRSINEAGGCVTLATGRSFYICGSYAADLGITIPLITSNGAALSDPVKLCDIRSVDFPYDVLRALIRLFNEGNVNATGYSSDGLYFFPSSSRRQFIDDYNDGVTADLKVPILADLNHSFNKFLVIEPSPDVIDKILAIPELQVVSSAKGFFDVMMKGPSKGSALLEIASMLNVPADMTFALGDSENDISLLQSAGPPIAMAGSDPAVLAAAEYVTTDCASDGFAKAVRDFILPLVVSNTASNPN